MTALFTQPLETPLNNPRQWGIILIIVFCVLFAPQVYPNDWTLNTADLHLGADIYRVNPAYVYPPWALLLLLPYRWMTATGARVAATLVLVWLAQRRKWSLLRFFAVIGNPYFVFALLFSNVDLLVMLLPILLWEAGGSGWRQALLRGLALALLCLKPQGTLLVILGLLWTSRRHLRLLAGTVAVAVVVMLPVSLLGTPPLLAQWLDNIFSPAQANLAYWAENNASITAEWGIVLAGLSVTGVLGAVYVAMKYTGLVWTDTHTLAALFAAAMFLSPYTSNQSLIVPVALLPSWRATLLHLLGVFGLDALLPGDLGSWAGLLFIAIALWCYRPPQAPGDNQQHNIKIRHRKIHGRSLNPAADR